MLTERYSFLYKFRVCQACPHCPTRMSSSGPKQARLQSFLGRRVACRHFCLKDLTPAQRPGGTAAILTSTTLAVSRHASVSPRYCMQVAIMATITGTMFLRTRIEPNSVLNGSMYMSVCFYSVMIMMFNGLTEMTIAVLSRAPACCA